jgi:hypothetical protein
MKTALVAAAITAAWLAPIAVRAIARHFRRENAKLTRLVDLDGDRTPEVLS